MDNEEERSFISRFFEAVGIPVRSIGDLFMELVVYVFKG